MEDNESVRAEQLLEAQANALALFNAVETEGIIRPGVLDSEASDAIGQLAADQFGCTEHWHKRIVRSGEHTLQPYNMDPPDREMTDDDIAFGDFGPVFSGWEADFGRTWVIGGDVTKTRLRDDLAPVFAAGKAFYEANENITAAELFAEVHRLTGERGWEFGNMHCGHLVGEFPHENFSTNRIENLLCAQSDRPLRDPDPSGRVAHWILEIHLVDRAREIGGFYEELLTL